MPGHAFHAVLQVFKPKHQTALFMALIRQGALVLPVLTISRALIVASRSGVDVEILTRQPILISTGDAPLRAEVGNFRI